VLDSPERNEQKKGKKKRRNTRSSWLVKFQVGERKKGKRVASNPANAHSEFKGEKKKERVASTEKKRGGDPITLVLSSSKDSGKKKREARH